MGAKLNMMWMACMLACTLPAMADAEQKILFHEDFSSGFSEGFLNGQQGWKGTGLTITPVVVNFGGGEWGLAGYKGDQKAKWVGSDFELTREDRVVLEMTLTVPETGSFSVLLGLGMASPYNMPATFGISQKGIMVRGATYGGEQTFSVRRNNVPWDLAGETIMLRSVWDLQMGQASLYLKNLTCGEKEFTPLYFDAQQQDAAAPLGELGPVGDWAELMIRLGGGPELKIHEISIEKRAAPARKRLAVYRIGNSLTEDSQPNGITALAAQRNILHDTGYHIRNAMPPKYMWENPLDTKVPPNHYGALMDALPNYAWNAVTIQPYNAPSVPTTLLDDEQVILSMIALTRRNPANSNTVFYIYAAWPKQTDWGEGDAGYASQWVSSVSDRDETPTTLCREYFNLLLKRVRSQTDATVCMIPVGEVLYELDTHLRNGEVPGYTSIRQLYRDTHHLTRDIGRFTAGLTVFSVVHRETPERIVQPEVFYRGDDAFTPEMYAAIYASIKRVAQNQRDGEGMGEKR